MRLLYDVDSRSQGTACLDFNRLLMMSSDPPKGEIEDYLIHIYDSIASINIAVANNAQPIINTISDTLQLTCDVLPSTTLQDVNWSIIPGTGDASISNSGLVTAIAAGTVWAKATSTADITKADSIEITISQTVSIDSVNVITSNNSLPQINTKGGTLQLIANIFPNTASQDVTWSISNTAIASISNTGMVTAITDGKVWAKAVSSTDNTKTDSLEINISNQILSINQNIKNLILSLSPNPAKETLNINLTDDISNYELSIYDINGRLLINAISTKENQIKNIDISNLPNGIYSLTLLSSQINKTIKFEKN